MGYTFKVGEADLTEYIELDDDTGETYTDLRLTAEFFECNSAPEVPEFVNRRLNILSVPYGCVDDFCVATGLLPLFRGEEHCRLHGASVVHIWAPHREQPFLMKPSGVYELVPDDVRVVKEAERELYPTDPRFAMWMDWFVYWFDWAVKNCKQPVIVVS